jgi:LacI family transcriptional regulator
MKVTMQEVAQRAGVSKALVSRYLNAKPGVSPASRSRIENAVEHLHYRLPGTREGSAVSIILDGLSAFHEPLLRSCFTAALAEGYVLTIVDCFNDTAIKAKAADILSQGLVRGVLVYGSSISDKSMIDIFIRQEIPLVLIENDLPGVEAEKILIDNFQGQYNITKTVISRGFRDIRMIPWNLSTRAGTERMAGFLAALRENELLGGHSSVCLPEKPGFWGVFEIVENLKVHHNLPEVLVCGGDTIATYVLTSCQRLGIRVPEALSVTGFDGVPIDIYAPWGSLLTSMRQPLDEMGDFAVKRLLTHIKNSGEPRLTTLFHTTPVPGETLGSIGGPHGIPFGH